MITQTPPHPPQDNALSKRSVSIEPKGDGQGIPEHLTSDTRADSSGVFPEREASGLSYEIPPLSGKSGEGRMGRPSGGRRSCAEAEAQINGPYPDMARYLITLMRVGEPDALSTHQVKRLTGIAHGTVASIMKGDRPSFEVIVRLAQGFAYHGYAVSLNQMLTLCGYPTIKRAALLDDDFPGETTDPLDETQAKAHAMYAELRRRIEKHIAASGSTDIEAQEQARRYLYQVAKDSVEFAVYQQKNAQKDK